MEERLEFFCIHSLKLKDLQLFLIPVGRMHDEEFTEDFHISILFILIGRTQNEKRS